MDSTDANRSVDVIVLKGNQDFHANPGNILHAPRAIGAGGSHAHPGRTSVIKRGISLRMIDGSLPVKLHFDTTKFIGKDFFPCRADHNSDLDTVRSGLGVLRVVVLRHDGDAAADCFKAAKIGRCW